MPRIALCLRYDGSAYHGWQWQKNLPTIQEKLETALSFVANHTIKVVCAGRTDAGVHATAQIVHFDTQVERSEKAWVMGSNTQLPPDISVVWAKIVSDDFHARFKAIARRYCYIFYNDKIRPAIQRQAVTWWHRPLDEKQMNEASQLLLGEHDFSAFRGSGCQSNTPMRCVQQLNVFRHKKYVIIDITANAFLLHMVRNIAGVLALIGSGDHPSSWARDVLNTRDRRCAAATLSPCGLYLVEVSYPALFALPDARESLLYL